MATQIEAAKMAVDHERIWLEPECCADPCDGRMWCQDNQWPADGCSAEGTEYVRADIAAARDAAMAAEVERLARERDAADAAGFERGVRAAVACFAKPYPWKSFSTTINGVPNKVDGCEQFVTQDEHNRVLRLLGDGILALLPPAAPDEGKTP